MEDQLFAMTPRYQNFVSTQENKVPRTFRGSLGKNDIPKNLIKDPKIITIPKKINKGAVITIPAIKGIFHIILLYKRNM